MRDVKWLASSLEDLKDMPEIVRAEFGHGLFLIQQGEHPLDAKPIKSFGSSVFELIERHDGDTYRAVYTLCYAHVVYVLHCFQKKSPRGSEIPRPDKNLIERRLKDAKADAERMMR